MSGYVPVFDSVFHGTLCGRWPTLPVWLTILPMADKHGHIDMTYQAMSALTGWPIELLKQAITELTQPDPESRSESHEGRRLILIDPTNRQWGWIVVNHEKYREKARLSAKSARESSSGENAKRMEDRRRPPLTAADPLSNTNTNTIRDMSSSSTDVVFEHWKAVYEHPKAKLDTKRKRVISAALQNYSPDDLKRAISGYKNSKHHMGQNDSKTVYDDVCLFLRDATHIDAGLKFAEKGSEGKWL